jgi:hypothetical protein
MKDSASGRHVVTGSRQVMLATTVNLAPDGGANRSFISKDGQLCAEGSSRAVEGALL